MQIHEFSRSSLKKIIKIINNYNRDKEMKNKDKISKIK